MNIRKAVTEDLDTIVEMGERFWPHTPFAKKGVPFNRETVTSLIRNVIIDHLLIVAEQGDELVGFLGYFVIPLPFNDDFIAAQEMFFWVEPKYRDLHISDLMLTKAEKHLIEDVDFIMMGDLSTSSNLKEYYEERGYSLSERSYMKEV